MDRSALWRDVYGIQPTMSSPRAVLTSGPFDLKETMNSVRMSPFPPDAGEGKGHHKYLHTTSLQPLYTNIQVTPQIPSMASGLAHRSTKVEAAEFHMRDSKWKPPRKFRQPFRYDPIPKAIRDFTEQRPCQTDMLTAFPLEIIHTILFALDLASLRTARRVNSYFQASVESLRAYQLLEQYAARTLQVIYLMGLDSAVSVEQLFTEFCQPSCRGCGSFGPFVFLPTVRRCCAKCLCEKDEFQMIPTQWASNFFGITWYMARKSLPVIRCPEGDNLLTSCYSWSSARYLVCAAQALDLAIQTYGERGMIDVIRQRQEHRKSKCRIPCLEELLADDNPNPRRYLSKNHKFGDRIREWKTHGTTHLPFWDSKKQTTESGVYCSACTYLHEPLRSGDVWFAVYRSDRERVAFTLDTIPKHFEHCEGVKAVNKFGPRLADLWARFEPENPDFLVNERGEVVQPP
ncbi:hypothetical protein FQN54_000652 [Arachnomyces sp. PD_36]|nr:hypothetical protein FQN54_000652 [Arachnomyces sp. PD_36]